MFRVREPWPSVYYVERRHKWLPWHWQRVVVCASADDAAAELGKLMGIVDDEPAPRLPPPLPAPVPTSEAGRMGLDILRELEALVRAKSELLDALTKVAAIASAAHLKGCGRPPAVEPDKPAPQPSPAAIPRPAAPTQMTEERKRELREKYRNRAGGALGAGPAAPLP